MKTAVELYDGIDPAHQEEFVQSNFEKGKLVCDGCGFKIDSPYVISPASMKGKLFGRSVFLHIYPFQNLICQIRTCNNCKKIMGKPKRICKNKDKLYIMEGSEICDTVLEDDQKICPKCFSKDDIKFEATCTCGTENLQAMRVKLE